jgi:hypothetical protein
MHREGGMLHHRCVANKSNFTVEEWDQIRRVPTLVGLAVMAASPSGPLGVMRESSAAGEVLRGGLTEAKTELMQVVGQDVLENTLVVHLDSGDVEQIRGKALAACRELGNILRNKASEEEAEEFRQWLMRIATATAEAEKEGGFLGIGGVRVTEQETEMIDQIAIALR